MLMSLLASSVTCIYVSICIDCYRCCFSFSLLSSDWRSNASFTLLDIMYVVTHLWIVCRYIVTWNRTLKEAC